jgi:vacuolar-type H+-ATPase subunit I/STV1
MLVKKVTIITPPEYESLILESLGGSDVIQLKEVSGPDLEWIRKGSERVTDYKALYQKIHSHYVELSELTDIELKLVRPGLGEFKRFAEAPEAEAEAVLEKLEGLIAQVKELKETQDSEMKRVVDELQTEITSLREELSQSEEAIASKIEGYKARLESVRALSPEEFKTCFAAGVMKNELISKLEDYMKRYPDLLHKSVSISSEESILFVFGSEEGRKWVESLFLVFEVKDIFAVLDTSDVLLVLDPKKREEVIEKYKKGLVKFKEGEASQAERKVARASLDKLQRDYDRRLKDLEAKYAEENLQLREEQSEALSTISYMDYLLRILSDARVPVLRTRVISVLQGWIPDDKIPLFEEKISEVESEIGEKLFIQFDEPGHADHNVPSPEPVFKPSMFQPAWKLTSLRGWPAANEINPMYITVIVFSFQFGLMYGDIGQGAIFLLAGFIMSRKYKRGMMSKLGTLFIPMGIFAIIFGIGYDSIFLVEGLLFHHNQFMPNPVHETTTLMKWVFKIATVEIIFGLVLGAINQWKAGHKWGVLGMHGLGMILYIGGLYMSAMEFIRTSDFMSTLGYWGFYVMLSGMALAMLEPIISAVAGGHFTIEVIGEGVGALLMTFVEGLANLFSFLRIVAFALAHASLANAAVQLGGLMGNIPSLILMNLIAMTFEFMSSGVQSVRLLYYEFMGKFYHGSGAQFRPYRLRIKRS